MLELLYKAERLLPRLLNEEDGWTGLYADSEKPHLTRLWRQWGPYRINLHDFRGCGPGDAFAHPHPWAFAVRIHSGRYKMSIGAAGADPGAVPPDLCTVILGPGDCYEMTHRRGYHRICPLDEESRTLMVSGPPSWPENRVRANAPTRVLTASEMRAFRDSFRPYYDVPAPLFKDLKPVRWPAASWIQSADVPSISTNTADVQEASKAAKLQAALTELGRFEREVAKEAEPEMDDAVLEEALGLTSGAVYLAWTMSLAAFAEENGGVLKTAELDESMLPPDVSDDSIMSFSGGLAGLDFTREVLKRYKATLPAGTHLPDWIVETLDEEGVLVY